MSADYCRLLSELQEAKKEISSLRNKNNTLSADNSILESNASSLKRTVATLRDSVAALEAQNAALTQSNASMAASYQEDINAFKTEIAKREQEISVGLKNTPEVLGMNLVRKQVECEVEQRFRQELDKKDEKISALQGRVDKLNRQVQLEKEKGLLAGRESSRRIQELEDKHLQELKQYAQRVYAESQKRTFNSEDNMLKRMRKQLEELRGILTHKDNQIQNLMEEKNILTKQKNNAETRAAKETSQLHENIKNYKTEVESSKDIQSLQQIERENNKIREQDREIRRLKQKVEDLHSELKKKDIQISDLEVRNTEVTHDIQKIKSKTSKANMEEHEELRIEKESLQREKQSLQRELRQVTEQCRSYRQRYSNQVDERHDNRSSNIQKYSNAVDKRYDNRSTNNQNYSTAVNQRHENISEGHTKNIKDIRNEERVNIGRNQTNVNNLEAQSTINRKNIINQTNIVQERNIRNVRSSDDRNEVNRVHRNRDRDNSSPDWSPEDDVAYANPKGSSDPKVEKEREKVRDIARKYIALQTKYQKVKGKLNEANDKILQLIRSKISMQSPPRKHPGRHRDEPAMQDQFSATNPRKSRGRWASPQPDVTNTSQRHFMRTGSPKDRHFYEKSLSFKSKSKLKDLTCINHAHYEDDNEQV